jgi:hypothetical protein
MHFISNDNAEILLKVALNTITLTPYIGHDIYLTDHLTSTVVWAMTNKNKNFATRKIKSQIISFLNLFFRAIIFSYKIKTTRKLKKLLGLWCNATFNNMLVTEEMVRVMV